MDKISEENIAKFKAFLLKPNDPHKSVKISDCPPLIISDLPDDIL